MIFSLKICRLSRLQVLTNAIDYIRQLRQTLGLPPCISSPGQQDHPLSSYSFPPSQSRTNDSSQEYHTKSQAHVWLVSLPCSPSYHHDNKPSSPAIPWSHHHLIHLITVYKVILHLTISLNIKNIYQSSVTTQQPYPYPFHQCNCKCNNCDSASVHCSILLHFRPSSFVLSAYFDAGQCKKGCLS